MLPRWQFTSTFKQQAILYIETASNVVAEKSLMSRKSYLHRRHAQHDKLFAYSSASHTFRGTKDEDVEKTCLVGTRTVRQKVGRVLWRCCHKSESGSRQHQKWSNNKKAKQIWMKTTQWESLVCTAACFQLVADEIWEGSTCQQDCTWGHALHGMDLCMEIYGIYAKFPAETIICTCYKCGKEASCKMSAFILFLTETVCHFHWPLSWLLIKSSDVEHRQATPDPICPQTTWRCPSLTQHL